MSIEFESDNFGTRQGGVNNFSSPSSSGSAMVDFLIKNGIAKDASSGNTILTVGALFLIGLSIYFFIYGFSLPQKDTPPVEVPVPGLEV